MRVSSVSLAVLSLAAGASAATKSTLAGLSAHLSSNKLTGFAGAFGGLGASTSYIKTLSAALASGKPITLLAPTNAVSTPYCHVSRSEILKLALCGSLGLERSELVLPFERVMVG